MLKFAFHLPTKLQFFCGTRDDKEIEMTNVNKIFTQLWAQTKTGNPSTSKDLIFFSLELINLSNKNKNNRKKCRKETVRGHLVAQSRIIPI